MDFAAILERCSFERLVTIYLTHVRNVPLCLLGLAPWLESLALKSVSFVPESDHRAQNILDISPHFLY